MTALKHKNFPNDRLLFLGDIENLAWDQSLNTVTVSSIQQISFAVHTKFTQYNAQEVIATSHHFAKKVWFAWGRTTRRLLGSGPDGADRKLIDLINNEDIAQRFTSVIIGSGDGIFAEPAAQLAAQGLHITAAYGSGGLSKRLALAAHETIQLFTPKQTEKVA